MKTLPLLLSASFLAFAACGKDAAPAKPAANGPVAEPLESGAHAHGDEKPIGPMTLGAYSFTVVQLGDVKAGAEAVFELEFAKDAKVPSLARAWLGVESGQGSMKARFGKEGDHGLHAHVQAPDALGADAKLWIEIEADGVTERAATAWK
jgi:hypothetical protein